MDNVSSPESTTADRNAMVELIFGHMAAQTVATATRLGVADHLDPSGGDPEVLAVRIGTNPNATLRLLRALSALGVATERAPGSFQLTARGSLLRTSVAGSLHSFVSMFLDPTVVESWKHLSTSIHSGQTCFRDVFGSNFFDYLADHPDMSRTFNESMRQGTRHTATVLPDAYDFTTVGTVADVGGGDGTLLAHLLAAHPHLTGILFDTEQGSAQANERLTAAGVAERCHIVTGDFFTGIPVDADVYLLKSVLHDWDNEANTAILSNMRRVIDQDSRVLVIESVLPERVDGSLPPTTYLSDLNMLINLGGRERTLEEFRYLCTQAKFALSQARALPSPSPFSLIEAAPAPRET